jgi:hypothetical protein
MEQAPDRLDLSLRIPGLLELEPLVDDFVRRVVQLAGFDGPRVEELVAAVRSAVLLVEAELEQAGEVAVPLDLKARIDALALEISLLEHGHPLGDGALDGAGADIPTRVRPAHVFDDVHWVQRGPDGSELHMRLARPHARIDVLTAVEHRVEAIESAADHAVLDPSHATATYRTRGFRAGDGLAVAERIYEAYGHSYPNPDLYYPERVEALNRSGKLHSILCESDSGELVGHYALERPDLGPIGEAGQAVVDHRHRGHGLMRPMRQAVEDAGRELGLLGIWSQPTARHPFSQRMNLGFGSVPQALCLGTTPGGTTLRGGGSGAPSAELRYSCFLYWHSLRAEEPIEIDVPESLVPLLTELYAARGRPCTPREPGRVRSPSQPVRTRFDRARRVGFVTTHRIGQDSLGGMRAAIEALRDAAGAESLFVDLPIDQAGCGHLAAALLTDGLRVAGIGPRFRATSSGAEDVLRLQLPVAAFDEAGLTVEGDLGEQIARAALTAE